MISAIGPASGRADISSSVLATLAPGQLQDSGLAIA